MVYKKKMMKKRPIGKKNFARKAVAKAKTASLVKLIKKVSLRQSETKHTHQILENLQLYHNTPYLLSANLNTTQSVGDDGQGTTNFACRIGDEIKAKGLSFKFWFANKLDRPNVMYKIIFFWYQADKHSTLAANTPYLPQGSSNYMIRDLDTEQYKIIKVVRFNLQTSAQRITGADTFSGAESHKAITVWLPLKNRTIKYQNGSSLPRFVDVGYSIVAYDSYGTLTTDNIASYAVNRKLYFKDP